MLVLNMIEILPPLEKYKYDTWRILPVKCYIENSVHFEELHKKCQQAFLVPLPGRKPVSFSYL
jgi:hypothetical protein